jgi:hypothetical protein
MFKISINTILKSQFVKVKIYSKDNGILEKTIRNKLLLKRKRNYKKKLLLKKDLKDKSKCINYCYLVIIQTLYNAMK